MKQVDVDSPPYPGEHTIPGVLFEHLLTMRDWIAFERDKLGELQEVVPRVQHLPVKTAFEQQPILFLWQSFIHLRRIRESWDHLLRTYETDWDDAICLRGRALILQQAVSLLNSAGQSAETREIQDQRRNAQLHAIYVHLAQQLAAPLQPMACDNGTSLDLEN